MNQNMTQVQPQPAAPKITFNDTTEVTCQKCGGKLFQDAIHFRKVSRLLTGKPNDEMIPVPVPICISCKAPLKDLLSPEVAEAL